MAAGLITTILKVAAWACMWSMHAHFCMGSRLPVGMRMSTVSTQDVQKQDGPFNMQLPDDIDAHVHANDQDHDEAGPLNPQLPVAARDNSNVDGGPFTLHAAQLQLPVEDDSADAVATVTQPAVTRSLLLCPYTLPEFNPDRDGSRNPSRHVRSGPCNRPSRARPRGNMELPVCCSLSCGLSPDAILPSACGGRLTPR